MEKAERQIEAILDYLRDYISTNGFSPSYREISLGVGLKSTNSIKAYLDVLEQRGLISRQTNKNRTIEIIGKNKSETIDLPLVGQVAAGEPILAEQNIEEYVTSIPDFPEPGIIFRDVTSVLQDADGLSLALDTMQDLICNLLYNVIKTTEK